MVQSPPAFHTFGELPAIKETKSYVKDGSRGCRSLVHLSVEQGTYAVGSYQQSEFRSFSGTYIQRKLPSHYVPGNIGNSSDFQCEGNALILPLETNLDSADSDLMV
ncbi:hypothetical protein IEQ34_024587 [Dendrobium chrysotoxum]|uniref:Uncharacterized protein n=1 Tax=Dendrobium chrysotoxum TaxID=161865 RepID=A0AAV7FRK9_DENCH|nr:hypothetical protein IEQ34_024587 [Dendrobium chrysotoxum]